MTRIVCQVRQNFTKDLVDIYHFNELRDINLFNSFGNYSFYVHSTCIIKQVARCWACAIAHTDMYSS